jgi:ergothioneine biosynthesis protein EgtB
MAPPRINGWSDRCTELHIPDARNGSALDKAMEASRAQSLLHDVSPAAQPSLLRRYRDIRQTTLDLSQPFSPEDQMLQSMTDASPMKWHLAHTTWFFETFILAEHGDGYRCFDARYKYLFNSYYKQLGSHPYRGSRGLMSRPRLDEVHAYRHWVDNEIERQLDRADDSIRSLLELGLNHEQQHQELMVTDIKHALWSMPLQPENSKPLHSASSPAPVEWMDIAGGIYEIGHAGDGFAFDNEGPRHKVLLRPFQIASRQVTNTEFLEFVQEGGYRRPELWLSDGWDAVCSQGWSSPLYWEQRDGHWIEFTLGGFVEVDPGSPVCHVSYYEADAFARWRGARLAREEEWEVAVLQASAAQSGEFLETGKLHPQAVRGNAPQWLGNAWEWTSSPYVAYPGFVPAGGLIGEYNGKFMCNQFVLRGGSCATPAGHIRATYRNFFPPHARWQFMGIRLAQ